MGEPVAALTVIVARLRTPFTIPVETTVRWMIGSPVLEYERLPASEICIW